MPNASPPPSSDGLSMPVLLRYARNVYASAMRDALVEAGFDDIPESGLHLIGGLARRNVDRPMSQLVAELGISKQAASQLVETLVVRGYLQRDADPDDRRRLTIALTDRGFAAAKVLGTSRAKVDAALIARARPTDVESTRRTLALLADMSRGPDTGAEAGLSATLTPTPTMPTPDLAIPTLPSRSLPDTLAFYARLGFTGRVLGAGDTYAILTRDSIELHFFAHPELDPLTSHAGCYVRVQDADGLHAAFTMAALPADGIPRLAGIDDRPWGMREFAVVDPDGNLLRIGQEV